MIYNRNRDRPRQRGPDSHLRIHGQTMTGQVAIASRKINVVHCRRDQRCGQPVSSKRKRLFLGNDIIDRRTRDRKVVPELSQDITVDVNMLAGMSSGLIQSKSMSIRRGAAAGSRLRIQRRRLRTGEHDRQRSGGPMLFPFSDSTQKTDTPHFTLTLTVLPLPLAPHLLLHRPHSRVVA